MEAVESRTSALENQQAVYARLYGDALAASCDKLDGALVGPVAEERVRVSAAVDSHATPAVNNNLDMCDMNVAVGIDKVLAKDGSEELRRVNGVLLGEDVDSLFLGIGCDDRRVVCLGVAATCQTTNPRNTLMFWCNSRLLNVTLKKSADSHLGDVLNTILLTAHL